MAFTDELDQLMRTLLDPDQGHSESVTRYVQGDPNNTESLQALFEPQQPERDPLDPAGDRIVYMGILEVSSAQTVHEDDVWSIRGQDWQTFSFEPAVAGLRAINVKRTDRISTKRSRVRS